MHTAIKQPLVRLVDVSVRTGQTMALEHVDWALAPNEHWAIVGRNGAGKTTFMRVARAEQHPAQGMGHVEWVLDGQGGGPAEARQAMLIVSADDQDQYTRLGRELCGTEVVVSGLRGTTDLFSPATPEELATARELLAEFDAAHLADTNLTAMSRGQARLVLIIRALAARPRVLLLDEALDGLDRHSAKRVNAAVETAATQGMQIVFCTHRKGEIPDFITHAGIMESGRLVRQGPRSVVLDEARRAAEDEEVPQWNGCSATDLAPHGETPEFLVRMRNATVLRAGRHILSGVDWTIRPGERWAVLGRNGAGKSTLVRLMTAEMRCMANGRVDWFGASGPTDIAAVRQRIGLVSPELQAAYRYDVPALELVQSGFFHSIGLWCEPSPEETARARSLMNLVGMAAFENRHIRSLSYGQLRRLLIARALAPRPDLLLLDEPCTGLDAVSRASFLRTTSLLCEAEMSMVFISHAPEELPDGMTHVLVLDEGRIHCCGRIDDLGSPASLLP